MKGFVSGLVLSVFALSLAVCGSAHAAEPIRIAYSSVNPKRY